MDRASSQLLFEHLTHWYEGEELEAWLTSSRPAVEVAAELATYDFAFFCRYYLPHFFKDRPARCHWEVFNDIQWAVTNDRANKLAESLPRGFGKSTIVCVGLPLWTMIGQDGIIKRGAAREPLKHYVWLIKDSFDQAKLELAAIKDEIETNERLIHDFGQFRGDIWAKAEMVTSNGMRIEAIGTGQKVRGRRFRHYRPDLIVGDDLENDKTVKSPTLRQEVKNWWSAAVEKAGDPKMCDYINIGTLMHFDCLQAWVLTRPGVRGRKFKALLREADNQQYWDQWRILETNLDDPYRERTAHQFYQANKEIMDVGVQVSWPERFDYVTLQLMRLGEKVGKGKVIKTFGPEMQNEPISDEDRLFKRFHYWRWEQEKGHNYLVPYAAGERVHLQRCRLFGACDPSLGEAHNGSYSALVDLLISPAGRMFVAHADLDRRHPDRIIDAIRVRCEYWARLGMFYSLYGIEAVQFQKLFASGTGQRLLASGIKLPIAEIGATQNKNARIDSLQPDITNGYLLLYREQHTDVPESQGMLYDQLWEYPMGDFVDGPDALEIARTLAATGSYVRSGSPTGMMIGGAASIGVGNATAVADPFG